MAIKFTTFLISSCAILVSLEHQSKNEMKKAEDWGLTFCTIGYRFRSNALRANKLPLGQGLLFEAISLLIYRRPKSNENIVIVFVRPHHVHCLLYTSPSPRDRTRSRMPSSAWKKKYWKNSIKKREKTRFGSKETISTKPQYIIIYIDAFRWRHHYQV